jgi:prepilin-type N-terminal cleavage/methylation domain-containing protein
VDVRTHRRGVTLFESIVVMVVLVIAAGAATLTYSSAVSGSTPLNAAADVVKAGWADARARAVAESRPYRFSVQEGTGKFRIAPDSPEFWEGGAGSSAPAGAIDRELPQNISFCGAQSTDPSQTNGQQGAQGGGGWTCPIVFLPDGRTQQDAEIAFGGQGTKTLTLKVRASTGAVITSP